MNSLTTIPQSIALIITSRGHPTSTGLNSLFLLLVRLLSSPSSSDWAASCHSYGKDHSLPYYLPIAGGRIVRCVLFQKVLALCEIQPHSRFELWLLCPFPTIVTIPLWAPPCIMIRNTRLCPSWWLGRNNFRSDNTVKMCFEDIFFFNTKKGFLLQ